MSETCLVTSSPASVTVIFTPRSLAAFSAPSTRVTKKGLFWVETDRPIVPLPTISTVPAAAKESTFSAVTRVTSTGIDLAMVSPLMSFTALSTAVEPIRAGCWAMVPAILPALMDSMASSVASKPITRMSLPAPAMASMAPRAISSLAAKTALISPLPWSIFSITAMPSARSKLAT